MRPHKETCIYYTRHILHAHTYYIHATHILHMPHTHTCYTHILHTQPSHTCISPPHIHTIHTVTHPPQTSHTRITQALHTHKTETHINYTCMCTPRSFTYTYTQVYNCTYVQRHTHTHTTHTVHAPPHTYITTPQLHTKPYTHPHTHIRVYNTHTLCVVPKNSTQKHTMATHVHKRTQSIQINMLWYFLSICVVKVSSLHMLSSHFHTSQGRLHRMCSCICQQKIMILKQI